MSVPLRIEIMQRETIKSSSPTPLHLRSLKLSLLDQFMPVLHIPLLLFYPRNGNHTDHLAKATERSLLLKTSMSEALTHFYPFAGRLRQFVHWMWWPWGWIYWGSNPMYSLWYSQKAWYWSAKTTPACSYKWTSHGQG